MPSIDNKLVGGALGALTTVVMQKVIRQGWTTITGKEPPEPDNLEASTATVVAWVAASAIGVTIAQVLVKRIAAKRLATGQARSQA